MVLIFGGTTEGRKAAEVLEEAGSPYFYSTKTGEQDIALHHGTVISGAMDGEAMLAFCREHGIRLVVDAAHPFATQLHETIARVCSDLQVPIVRYERIYPPRDPSITWIDDYSDVGCVLPSFGGAGGGWRLLATTGVQSIGKLKPLEREGVKVIYRILKRESSIQLAHQQGATDEQLCFYEDKQRSTSEGEVNALPDAEAILLKESGLSGGFVEKVEAAKKKGMRIIALKRPLLFNISTFQLFTVNGPYGLRRAVEKLLPEFFPLHSGLTTGTCATAAAVAQTMRLLHGEKPAEVPVLLPNGETIMVPVGYSDNQWSMVNGQWSKEVGYAYCIKEAGDDPDVTNGIEVRAAPLSSPQEGENFTPVPLGLENIEVYAGKGIGRFTLPGFDFPPGEPAINKGPREMIRRNLEQWSMVNGQWSITISVPDGAEIARRTFNPRLGIEGGISIIGVSGIVKPFSEEAFIDSIRKCMEVAKASGAERIVINSGFKSEQFLKTFYPTLPAQAFVQYGNYIGETLRMAHELSIRRVTLGVMLGKAVKLAQGHLDTHSRKTVMDKDFISQLLSEAGCSVGIDDITLARKLWEKIPPQKLSDFAHSIIRHCLDCCKPLLPEGELTILLMDDNGNIYDLKT
jgi:cobalt-precorrin-5B (C1)-methyltransferase